MITRSKNALILTKNQELIISVRNNDMKNVIKLLNEGANINFQDISSDHNPFHTPLYIAVSNNYLNMIKCLLEKHADPNITADARSINGEIRRGYSPLMIASERGYINALKLLVTHGADVNFTHHTGNSALHQAYSIYVTKILLEYGAELNIQNFKNNTPLHLVSIYGDNESIKLLVKQGGQVNIKNDDGDTPLHSVVVSDRIVMRKYSDTVDILLRLGADLSLFNYNGELALHLATDRNMDDINIIDCLIDQIKVEK